MRIKYIAVFLFIAATSIGYWFLSDTFHKGAPPTPPLYRHTSPEGRISFEYPTRYFLQEKTEDTGTHILILMEDTPENQALAAGTGPVGADRPPTITISIFKNSSGKHSARSFIEKVPSSNFALSDGEITETAVGGEAALRYRADGPYPNDNVVVAHPDFVYMFTGFFNAPTDTIRTDFEQLLETVTFVAPSAADPHAIACPPLSQRGEFCTQEYNPVCARVAVQCVTEPCDPVRETFSNACTACLNSLVSTYTPGACAAP